MTRRCFNTQPPEGGWVDVGDGVDCGVVSTHSRPKAAGSGFRRLLHLDWVSTHSRPKAAGIFDWSYHSVSACFNTQPPEGGWPVAVFAAAALVCFNTQPPEGGWPAYSKTASFHSGFQHTAARRRLGFKFARTCRGRAVSTHSRPKAAGPANSST